MKPTTTETEHYLSELPGIFTELARGFANDAHRPEGALESHAGQTAADFLGLLKLIVDDGRLTAAQAWSALAAERGSAGACNTLSNLSRAVAGQLCQGQAAK